MGTQEKEKHLKECTDSNDALQTWVFSVLGALVAIPVGIKRKSLGPLIFFDTIGTMLDIIIGVTQCEREHAELQMKLLQASQNATAFEPIATTNNAETDSLS
ncbi:hypothetical protein N665_0089s0014 [Sinapis alba]|nr:hypothetical protein N665_0089s0014 [Sinapis alba]